MEKPDLSQLDEQAIRDLANLGLELSHDEKTRPAVNDVLKRKFNKSLPDIEMSDIRAGVRKEFEKRDHLREVEKMKTQLETQREAVSSRYDAAGVAAIEALMEKHSLSDYEVGATLYGATAKAAAPTYSADDHMWSLPKMEIKDYGNLKNIRINNLYKAIGDLERTRAK